MASNLPERIDTPFDGAGERPDPLDRAELYDGLLWRRTLAFFVDAALLCAAVVVFWMFNILTFFIFTGLILFFWAAPLFVIYDTATVGGANSATLGMRLLGLEVRSWDDTRPGFLQAFVFSALFWFLVPLTGGLILLVAPFSNRRRHAHDLLSGIVVINARAAAAPQLNGPSGR